MLFKRIWTYLLGYCVILVEGPRKERFINLAIIRGIDLWDIAEEGDSKLWGKVLVDGIKPLRHIARISRCRFKIISKKGMPFLALKAEKRKGLVVGALLFLVALYWLSSYVWFLDVHSAKPLEHLSKEKVLTEAAKAGLKAGVPKSKLDLARLEKELSLRLPETTFIAVDLQGTLARIEIVEKKIVTDKNGRQPAHIIATKDGIVEEILVLAGDPRALVGDTVQKGQVLISGIVPSQASPEAPVENGIAGRTEGQASKIVRARGIIRARVWYEKTAQVPLVEHGKSPTGQKITQVKLKVGKKQIVLKGPRQAPYQLFDTEVAVRKLNNWRNLQAPVEVIQTTYYEMAYYRREYTADEALKKAKESAMAELNREIPAEAKILDQKVEALEAEPGKVKVKAWVETLEDIGMLQEFRPTN